MSQAVDILLSQQSADVLLAKAYKLKEKQYFYRALGFEKQLINMADNEACTVAECGLIVSVAVNQAQPTYPVNALSLVSLGISSDKAQDAVSGWKVSPLYNSGNTYLYQLTAQVASLHQGTINLQAYYNGNADDMQVQIHSGYVNLVSIVVQNSPTPPQNN